jgi:hypothetical protein
MDEVVDLSDQRRARRLRIGFRLVFYPLALGLIALAWQNDHGGAAAPRGPQPVGWEGLTSQGRVIKGVTYRRLLETLNTYVVERCSDGSTFTFHWFPARHRFAQNGNVLHGHQVGIAGSGPDDVWNNSVWATLGEHPRGKIRAKMRLTTVHGAVHCDSGDVTFSLRRTER